MKKLLAAALLASLTAAATAIDRIDLFAGSIEAESWRIDGLQSGFEWSADRRLQFTLRARQIQLAAVLLENVELVCARFSLQGQRIDCPQGELAFAGRQLPEVRTQVAFSYAAASKKISLHASRLPIAQGSVALDFRQEKNHWTLTARLRGLDLKTLNRLFQQTGFQTPPLDVQGQLGGRLTLRGARQRVQGIDWQLRAAHFAYANSAGTQAGEKLLCQTEGRARANGADWQADFQLGFDSGMLYSDPLYVEFKPDSTATLDVQLGWRPGQRLLHITRLDMDHQQVVSGRLKAQIRLAEKTRLERLEISVDNAQLPGFFVTYLQPWLAGTLWDEVETDGELQGRLVWQAGGLDSLNADLKNVSLRENSGLFSVQSLNAGLRWDMSGTPRDTVLTWQQAAFRKLTLGKARLHLQSRAKTARLLEPLSVDVLDGRLYVDSFEVDATDGLGWQLDGVLSPISMQAFSKAVGWPLLAGQLSGVIPGVRYQNHSLRVGGTLLVQAFGGDITLRDLRIDEPMGLAPRLWTSARVEHLDLETLTRTFSFGRIEGKLQGEVNHLYMEAWQPVAFDAHFETPPDDDSRHRISQKAVDSISNLGGSGVSGALSRGFLRFLEDFPYRRLGIRCRLENGVCQMDGVAPAAADGYYLVQGRFIPPRLDMIGHEHRVDWQSLVERLVAVTSHPAPVVQ